MRPIKSDSFQFQAGLAYLKTFLDQVRYTEERFGFDDAKFFETPNGDLHLEVIPRKWEESEE